jgi:hypothetical protein
VKLEGKTETADHTDFIGMRQGGSGIAAGNHPAIPHPPASYGLMDAKSVIIVRGNRWVTVTTL